VLVPDGFGDRKAGFHGTADTLKLFEDNALLTEAVKQAGAGRVLAVDDCVARRDRVLPRDAEKIDASDPGVRARTPNRRRAVMHGRRQRDLAARIHGVAVRPDEWAHAVREGILIGTQALQRRAIVRRPQSCFQTARIVS
jgi:regulator of RNase E activity RraA